MNKKSALIVLKKKKKKKEKGNGIPAREKSCFRMLQ